MSEWLVPPLVVPLLLLLVLLASVVYRAIQPVPPTGPYQAVLLALIALAIYLIPVAVALSRRHRQIVPITVLNIALGWTGLGWMGALVRGLSVPSLPMLPATDANSTRHERIAGFTRESSRRPVSPPDVVSRDRSPAGWQTAAKQEFRS